MRNKRKKRGKKTIKNKINLKKKEREKKEK